MYTVQNLGYPTTQSIREEQWKEYSKHSSVKAAFRAIDKARAHLDYGQWDDHYRVINANGAVCQRPNQY